MSESNSFKRIIGKALDRAANEENVQLNEEKRNAILEGAKDALKTVRDISKSLADVNGDGKVDIEDIKLATEKAGYAWNKLSPELREAMTVGGAASIGAAAVPFIGTALMLPTFLMGTSVWYLRNKLKG